MTIKLLIVSVLLLTLISSSHAQQWTTSGVNIYNSNSGNVGIGTSVPQGKLDVRGAAIFGTSKLLYLNPDFTGNGEIPSGAFIGSSGSNSLALVPSGNAGTAGAKIVLNYRSSSWFSALEVANVASGYGNLLLMKSGGNVGIGTTSPGAKLDVNGTTYSREMYIGTPDANTLTYMGSSNLLAVNGTAVFVKAKVALYGNTWPDYVFSPSYKLTPLDSLEQFIHHYNHLPGVQSAADVEKSGIDIGENQTVLLKKIEELTLIVIEENKKAEAQQKLLELQNQRIAKLESKLKIK